MGQAKLKSGTMVNIGKDYSGKQDLYRVRVLAVYKDTIELELPKSEGEKPEIIERGELLTLSFAGRSALNTLNIKIKDINEHRKRFSVVRKSQLQTIQRRKYVRISLVKEIEYQRIVNVEDNFSTATMLDISASGLGMRLKELNGVAMYQVLDLRFTNLACDIYQIKGRVVRLNEEEDPDTGKEFYNIGVEFINLTNQQREKLIEWVLSKQREMRRKGLL
ncbi:MAG: flagellar brake protein [Bacillota bacterium]